MPTSSLLDTTLSEFKKYLFEHGGKLWFCEDICQVAEVLPPSFFVRDRIQTVEQLLDPVFQGPQDAQLEDVTHGPKHFSLLLTHYHILGLELEVA